MLNNRHSPVVLLFTVLSLISSCRCTSWNSLSSCSFVNDPYPDSFRPFGVDPSNYRYFLTNYGKSGETVYIVDTNNLPQPSVSNFLLSLPCQTVNVTDNGGNVLGSVMYNPLFGKSQIVSGSLGAIGSPNRINQLFSSSSSSIYLSVSEIDIYSLPSTTVTQVIRDYTSPLLGLLMAVDSTNKLLITTYSSTQLAVYSPVVSRNSIVHNLASVNGGGGDSDVFLNLPSFFSPDSFSLKFPLLAVTGLSYLNGLGFCVPSIVTYTYSSSAWSSFSLSYLIPGSNNVPATLANYNFYSSYRVPCRGSNSITPPANQYSVDLQLVSGSSYNIIIGQPTSRCVIYGTVNNGVFANSYSSFCENNSTLPALTADSFGFTTWSNSSTSLGQTVRFLNSKQFWVQASDYVALYDLSSTISSTSAYLERFPNKFLKTTIPSVNRQYLQMALTPNYILIAQNLNPQIPNSDIIYIPFLGSSQQYSPVTQTSIACPPGRFKSSASFSACDLCPAGTFASTSGSSSCTACPSDGYCPAGSTTNTYSNETMYTKEVDTAARFEADEYAEVFEALIVLAVFGGFSSKTMLIFFIFSLIIVALSLVRICTKGKISEIAMIPLRALASFHEGLAADIEKFEEEQEVSDSGVQAHHKHVHHDPTLSWWQREYGIAHMFEGYVTAVFFIFGLGAMAFIFTYLTAYDPNNFKMDTQQQNILRSLITNFVGTENPEDSASLTQLSMIGFNLFISLYGFSHMNLCTTSLLPASSITFSGCIPPSGSSVSCASNYTIQVDPSDSNACLVSLFLPAGTTLGPTSSFLISLPSMYSFSAVVFSYSHSASVISLPYPLMLDTQQSDTAKIASLTLSERVPFSPSDSSNTAYPALTARRSWLFTPLNTNTQRVGQWLPIFDSIWTRSIVSFSSDYLSSSSRRSFLYSNTDTAYTIGLDISQNNYYTINRTQRLVSEDHVILAMALGILGIYHLIHFGETILEFFFYHSMSLCCKKYLSKDSVRPLKRQNTLNGNAPGANHGTQLAHMGGGGGGGGAGGGTAGRYDIEAH